ncbi:MAG: lamin tail domain-containing protein, partial [Dehalococcoidia bacterium]
MRLLKALSVALLAAGLGAVLVPGVVIADGGSVANHVVISEVELDDSEWVELYNPTDSDVNIDEWYWCYYSSGSDWNDPDNHKALEGSISAESFFLLRIDGPVASPDWNTGYSSNPNTLNDSDGSVGIFTSDPADAEDVTNAKDLKKDVVAWGSVNHVKETAEASAPGAGESLQRKISDTQDEDSYGPAWDTDDNSNDFF